MVTTRSGAGGKMVTRRRRQRLAVTPIDRPTPTPPPLKSPNWFTSLIPSSTAIASGAIKILSSIFTDSETETFEHDEDFNSEDDVGNHNKHKTPCDGVKASTEMGQETHLNVRSRETKRIIEQLIMQETFSRDECDKLIRVLNLRVIDWLEAGENYNHEDVDIYDKAVLEAKKWFQDKKVGSSSATELAHQTLNLKSKGPEHVAMEDGSPVDVARSYMKVRPAWASPTKNVEIRTPLTSATIFFKEGTFYSAGHDSLSSPKKRSSLSSGSWNIQKELRRVREKASEDMLWSPSTRFDPSWFAVAPNNKESAGTGKVVMEERTTEPESLRKVKPIEVLVNSPALADGGRQSVNGRSSSQASLSAGEATVQNDVENHIADTTTEKKAAITNIEGNCVLLSEASIKVPIVSETDSIASGSQNSLGVAHEKLLLEKGNQRARKSGITRRSRGRGK